MRRTAVLLLVVAAVAGVAAVAHAQTPVRQGYWWVAETGLVTVPGPPSVPSDGLYVAADPAEPEAVTAVQLPLAPRPIASLELTAADVQGTPALQACATSDGWNPGGPNAWSTRPAPNCKTAQVTVTPDSTATHWTVPLASFVAAGVRDVLIQPSKFAQFSISFSAVTLHSFVLSSSTASPPSPAPSAAPTRSAPPPSHQVSRHAAPRSLAQPALPNLPGIATSQLPAGQQPQVASPPPPAVQPSTAALASRPASSRSYIWVLPAAWLVLTTWIWRARRSLRLLGSHPLSARFELATSITSDRDVGAPR